MRIKFAALSVAFALALASIGAPPAAANPTNAAQAKEAKAAESAARLIVKTAAKAVADHAKAAFAKLGALTRAAKTGFNVEALSGVPSTAGVKVSPEQLAGLADAAIRAEAEYRDGQYGSLVTAYEGYASNAAINVYGDGAATRRVRGADGVSDIFVSGLADGCTRGDATFGKSVKSFQAAELAGGFAFTRIAAPSIPLVAPRNHYAPSAPFDVSVIHSTWADSIGRFSAIVSSPGVTEVGDFSHDKTLIVMANQSGTLALADELVLPYVRVKRHEEPEPPVASEPFRIFVMSGTVIDADVAPVVPVSIVSPGPCEPALGKGPIVATPTALHLGPVAKFQEAQSKAIFLKNNGPKYLQVVVSIRGEHPSKFFSYNSIAYVPAGGDGLVECGGSSTTAGLFRALIHLEYEGGEQDVPIDLTVTN
jgi:hypothetical protein